MEKETVFIVAGSMQLGFLAAFARILSSRFEIVFVALNRLTAGYLRKRFPDLAVRVEDIEGPNAKAASGADLNRCLSLEEKYGERLSMILSCDRGLGKGYLFNATNHPTQYKTYWSMEKKYNHLCNSLNSFDGLVNKYHPKFVLSGALLKEVCIVLRYHKIPFFYLGMIKFGKRCFWVENEYYQNSHLINSLKDNIKNSAAEKIDTRSDINYIQEQISKEQYSNIDFSYFGSYKNYCRYFITELYRSVRGTGHRDGYKFLGWGNSILSRPRAYRFFKKHGVRPAELAPYRIVYFPLHLEPELALNTFSPEFNNSMEMVAWISKSLPADCVLVVKESPWAFGIRPVGYYENLTRIGNVRLAYPKVSSFDWIRAAKLTATITGTAAIESIYFNTPVLSFGKYQLVNLLETVRYVTDYESTSAAVEYLLGLPADDQLFKRSKMALYLAQIKNSFELPEYETLFSRHDEQTDNAEAAFLELKKRYDNLFAD